MSGWASVAPYLITAGATLGGVATTGLLSEYRERRRFREEQQKERERLVEERWKWLRQERRQSYAGLIALGHDAANLLMEASSRIFDRADLDGALELWSRLDEQRDAISAKVADVELVGSEEAIAAARSLRRTFRHVPNLVKQVVRDVKSGEVQQEQLSQSMSTRARQVFGAVNSLVEVSRRDMRIATEVDSIAGPLHDGKTEK